jgi:hypothetical protein
MASSEDDDAPLSLPPLDDDSSEVEDLDADDVDLLAEVDDGEDSGEALFEAADAEAVELLDLLDEAESVLGDGDDAGEWVEDDDSELDLDEEGALIEGSDPDDDWEDVEVDDDDPEGERGEGDEGEEGFDEITPTFDEGHPRPT